MADQGILHEILDAGEEAKMQPDGCSVTVEVIATLARTGRAEVKEMLVHFKDLHAFADQNVDNILRVILLLVAKPPKLGVVAVQQQKLLEVTADARQPTRTVRPEAVVPVLRWSVGAIPSADYDHGQ